MSNKDDEVALAKINDEDSTNVMRDALTAIAQEMQRFYCSSEEYGIEPIDNITDDLEAFKAKLKLKKKLIKKLKENLKTACTIAKTVITAKENETQSLNNHLAVARNESTDLFKKYAESNELIQKLTMENQVLGEKLQNFHNFIELGYNELQKMCNETVNEPSMLMKLKKIMIYCGQYYADYCNEHEKCLQLEQRNRFLNNKLSILENNLGSVSEELKNHQQQNFHKEKKATNEKKSKNDSLSSSQKIGFVFSESTFGEDNETSRMYMGEAENSKNVSYHSIQNLDLSSHLSLVKNLLNDQDTMLKDLKKLSEEMNS